MHHNTGRQRALKSSRMIKESKSRVKPFMWRVLREPKNLDTQRLGYNIRLNMFKYGVVSSFIDLFVCLMVSSYLFY